jgi:hypothetical protein
MYACTYACLLLYGYLFSFRLTPNCQIATLGYVTEITMLQLLLPDSPEFERNCATYMGCLTGWHESYLNSASYAYESNSIIDWLDFFSEDWTTALRYDHFPALASIIRNALNSDKGVISLLDKVMENAESTDELEVITQARRNILGDRGARTDKSTGSVVTSHVVDFVRKHKAYLPHFFVPDHKGASSQTKGSQAHHK